MKLRLFIVNILLQISLANYAQKGEYHLTHYHPDKEIENENFAAVQDEYGQMQFANTKGILKFDGRYWLLNKTPSTVLSLASDKKTGIIYVGCLDDFGYVSKDESGNEIYNSIQRSEDKLISISKIVNTDQYVYFQGINVLFQYSKNKNKITKQWGNSKDWDFEIFKCKDELYISDKAKGIFVVNKDKLKWLRTNIRTNEKIVFAPPIDAQSVFVGTDSNQYYLFNGKIFKNIKLKDAEYLKKSVIVDAIWAREDLVIIATNKGGCVLVNPRTGTTISIINYYSGLPDNEIFAIGRDKQSGIWIAHEYGLTRLNYTLPFRCYSNYPGLHGNITGAISFNENLYVSTNEGVYYLHEIRDYKEVTKYVAIKPSKRDKRKQERADRNDIIKNKIKSVFSFGKKETDTKKTQKLSKAKVQPKKEVVSKSNTKKPNSEKTKKTADKKGISAKTSAKKGKERKTIARNEKGNDVVKAVTNFELESVKYAYKKIKGIDGKCSQMIRVGNTILVATNNGLFLVQDSSAAKLIPDAISYLCLSNDKKHFFAGTDDKKLLTYKYNGQKWELEYSIADLPENIFNIAEDNPGNLWVSFSSSIIKYNSSFDNADTLKLNNSFSDDINLLNARKNVFAFIGDNVYKLDPGSDTLIKEKLIESIEGNTMRLIHCENNMLWYNNGQEWNQLSDIPEGNKNFSYLKLMKDIQKVFYDQDKQRCWIVTKDNQLYTLDLNSKTNVQSASNIFLRNVSDNEGHQLQINKISLNQNSSNVSFSFISPEYLDNESQLYSYKLNGYAESWSAWSTDNKVTFGYLPSGNYALVVRTKNALNQINEGKPLEFRVNPPYWQEWWFYMAEFIFFGTLLYLSIWLNTSGQKNQWITKGLTFLTIVLMIEFVNTVFESFLNVKDSPVFSFLLQVLLAIMIIPFERILSKIITQNPKEILTKVKTRLSRSKLMRKKKTNREEEL